MSSRYGRNQRRRHRELISLLEQQCKLQHSALIKARIDAEEARQAPINKLTAEANKHVGELVARRMAEVHDVRMKRIIDKITGYELSNISLYVGLATPHKGMTVLRIEARPVSYSFLVDVEEVNERNPLKTFVEVA